MADPIGKGTMVSGGAEPTVGTFVAILDVEGLMKAMDGGGTDLVAYLEHPNVTMMAPIQSRLAAIVCANGDEQAHVAIVSRELGLPCAVQLTLESDPTSLDGRQVRLDPDGSLSLAG
jgi:phosphoenolpyruvate synthase/pyruvate phosphate dikinase